ncbi:MAG TPA: SOS response-associated peptidase [Acetobacteraceae bacterium]|jgi:putative SOS response-associated peptidase YedK|nr:SOS response-associated peptidase [Acetobacteraceae bacterium]
MCGHYASAQPPEFIARLFRTVNALPNAAPSWNIAPSQSAMVVRRHPATGERHLDLLQWGLVPHWTKDPPKTKHPVNARAEAGATSGMFRGAFAQLRCLVSADAFYEWKVPEGSTQPYAIARHDGQPMANPSSQSSPAKASGDVKWIACIPSKAAAAALVALSSI